MKKILTKTIFFVLVFTLIISSVVFLSSCSNKDETPYVVSAQISSLPTKSTYIQDEALNLSGAVLILTYSDGSTSEYSFSETDVSDFSSAEVGNFEMTLTYTAPDNPATDKPYVFTVKFPYTVTEKFIVSMSVNKPSKTEYLLGETLDLSGLSATFTYNNNLTERIDTNDLECFLCDSNLKVNNGTLLNFGDSFITVKHKTLNFSATFDILVYKTFSIESDLLTKNANLLSDNKSVEELNNNLYIPIEYDDFMETTLISELSIGSTIYFANYQNFVYKYSNDISVNFNAFKTDGSMLKISTLALYCEYVKALCEANDSSRPPETITVKIISDTNDNNFGKLAYYLTFQNNTAFNMDNVEYDSSAPVGVLSGNYVYAEKNNTFTNSRINIGSGFGINLKVFNKNTEAMENTDSDYFSDYYFIKATNRADQEFFYERKSFNLDNESYSLEFYNYKSSDKNSLLPLSQKDTHYLYFPDIGLITLTINYIEALVTDVDLTENGTPYTFKLGNFENPSAFDVTVTLNTNLRLSTGKYTNSITLIKEECTITSTGLFEDDLNFKFNLGAVGSSQYYSYSVNIKNVMTESITDEYNNSLNVSGNYLTNFIAPENKSNFYFITYLNSSNFNVILNNGTESFTYELSDTENIIFENNLLYISKNILNANYLIYINYLNDELTSEKLVAYTSSGTLTLLYTFVADLNETQINNFAGIKLSETDFSDTSKSNLLFNGNNYEYNLYLISDGKLLVSQSALTANADNKKTYIQIKDNENNYYDLAFYDSSTYRINLTSMFVKVLINAKISSINLTGKSQYESINNFYDYEYSEDKDFTQNAWYIDKNNNLYINVFLIKDYIKQTDGVNTFTAKINNETFVFVLN